MTAGSNDTSQRRRKMRYARVYLGAALCICVQLGPQVYAQEGAFKPVLSSGRGFDENGGEAVFDSLCAACHQKDAKGAFGAAAYPSLASNQSLASIEYLEQVLFSGLRGMPPVGQILSDEQAADVINYVRTHFGNEFSGSVSAADVRAERDRQKSESR